MLETQCHKPTIDGMIVYNMCDVYVLGFIGFTTLVEMSRK